MRRRTGMRWGWFVPKTIVADCSRSTVSDASAIAARRAAMARLPERLVVGASPAGWFARYIIQAAPSRAAATSTIPARRASAGPLRDSSRRWLFRLAALVVIGGIGV